MYLYMIYTVTYILYMYQKQFSILNQEDVKGQGLFGLQTKFTTMERGKEREMEGTDRQPDNPSPSHNY